MATVRKLIKQLRDENPHVRREAANAFRDHAFASDEETREFVVGYTACGMAVALGLTIGLDIARNSPRIGGSIVVFCLGVFSCLAAWAWGKEDKWASRAVTALLEAIETDSDSEVRCLAAWALGRHASEIIKDDSTIFDRVVSVLREIEKHDADPSARSWATWALNELAPGLPHSAITGV